MYQALSAVREDDTERTKRRASPGRWQPEGSGCGSNFVQINMVPIIIKSLVSLGDSLALIILKHRLVYRIYPL
ncbi:hypothetical protein WM44_02985 [Citrobacter sp. AATXQ]|nr:hypothetical protein WM44_02985 [Citrobacter sp. AATXQ]